MNWRRYGDFMAGLCVGCSIMAFTIVLINGYPWWTWGLGLIPLTAVPGALSKTEKEKQMEQIREEWK